MVTYIILLHNNSVLFIVFNKKKKHSKFFSGGENDMGESVQKTGTLGCQEPITRSLQLP